MRAARDFVDRIAQAGDLEKVSRLGIELFGSLALTGRGHATDRAIILGLLGECPADVDPDGLSRVDVSTNELDGPGLGELQYRRPSYAHAGVAPSRARSALAEPFVVEAESTGPTDFGIDYDGSDVRPILNDPEIAEPQRTEGDRDREQAQ